MKLKCNKCLKRLPDSEFHLSVNKSRRNRQTRCKECARAWQRAHKDTLYPTEKTLHRIADKYRPKAS